MTPHLEDERDPAKCEHLVDCCLVDVIKNYCLIMQFKATHNPYSIEYNTTLFPLYQIPRLTIFCRQSSSASDNKCSEFYCIAYEYVNRMTIIFRNKFFYIESRVV